MGVCIHGPFGQKYQPAVKLRHVDVLGAMERVVHLRETREE